MSLWNLLLDKYFYKTFLKTMSRFTDLFSQTEQSVVVEQIHVVEEVHEESQVPSAQETVVDVELPKSNSKRVSTTSKRGKK